MKLSFLGPLRIASCVGLLCGALAVTAAAQSNQSTIDPCKNHDTDSYATLRLTNMTQTREIMSVVTALRNMLPCARIYFADQQSAISLTASAANMELARKIVAELDQPGKSYRVTFTLTELENGKRVAGRRFTMMVWGTERTTLRQGQRVPVTTASDKKDSDTAVQVQYVDIGLNLQATIDGRRLSTKVEESAVVPGAGAGQNPTIAQTVLEGSSGFQPGVAVVIGTLEEPGSTRRQEVEVTVEPVG